MKRKNDNFTMGHGSPGPNNVEPITLQNISFYISHFTSNSPQQSLCKEYKISIAPTQLSNAKTSLSVKPVDVQFIWILDSTAKGGFDVQTFIMLRFEYILRIDNVVGSKDLF